MGQPFVPSSCAASLQAPGAVIGIQLLGVHTISQRLNLPLQKAGFSLLLCWLLGSSCAAACPSTLTVLFLHASPSLPWALQMHTS